MRRKTNSTHKIHNLVEAPSGDVKALLDRLAKIQALNDTLQHKLNATLLKHCRVVNLRKSTLVIAVDSAVWANKLRFLLSDLIIEFRESGYYGLANIDIIIQPR